MEKYFGNAYRGDPGVPHSGTERFENIWIGSIAFSALTWFNPYMWQLSNQFNWHDKAMLLNNITGRRHVRRINHTNLSGIRWTRQYVTRTTSTGLSTSNSLLLQQCSFSDMNVLDKQNGSLKLLISDMFTYFLIMTKLIVFKASQP